MLDEDKNICMYVERDMNLCIYMRIWITFFKLSGQGNSKLIPCLGVETKVKLQRNPATLP